MRMVRKLSARYQHRDQNLSKFKDINDLQVAMWVLMKKDSKTKAELDLIE